MLRSGVLQCCVNRSVQNIYRKEFIDTNISEFSRFIVFQIIMVSDPLAPQEPIPDTLIPKLLNCLENCVTFNSIAQIRTIA